MKMTDRIKRNMTVGRKLTAISIRVPEHVLEDLKEVAPTLGFGGYQALIKAYISQGLRNDLMRLEAERERTELAADLAKHGVAHEVIKLVLERTASIDQSLARRSGIEREAEAVGQPQTLPG